MQTQNYWKQFENTGKIEDYLIYKTKSCNEGRMTSAVRESGIGALGASGTPADAGGMIDCREMTAKTEEEQCRISYK